jgi:cation diffusion facilitator family transporter
LFPENLRNGILRFMAASPDSFKSILFALFANLSIAVAKGFAAFFTGSSAMLAEAIHSLADSGNQLLLILGLRQSKRPPSAEYPLGYGKSIYFWSFLVALVLFSMGGLFSIYEGWHKLQHPENIVSPMIAVAVLVFGIIAESISLWGCLREVKKERYGRGILRWFRESRTSELVVVFGEDVAALLGLFAALAAVVHAGHRRPAAGDRDFHCGGSQGLADRPERGASRTERDAQLPGGTP